MVGRASPSASDLDHLGAKVEKLGPRVIPTLVVVLLIL